MTEYICSKCGYVLEAQPVDADNWICPICKTSNVIEAAPVGENWLDGLCHYSGPGHDLPVGGYCKIVKSGAPWGPELLARSWTVSDASTDEGIATKTTKELTADDIIIGVTLNPKTIAAIVATYGRDFYQIREANGGQFMTLDQWQTMFGTNGLGLVAMRNMRKKLSGGGVHF